MADQEVRLVSAPRPPLSPIVIAWIRYVMGEGREPASDEGSYADELSNEDDWDVWSVAVHDTYNLPAVDNVPPWRLGLLWTPRNGDMPPFTIGGQIRYDKPLVGRQIQAVTYFSTQKATGGAVVRIDSHHYQITAAWIDLPLLSWPPTDEDLFPVIDATPERDCRGSSHHLDYRLIPLGRAIENPYPLPLNTTGYQTEWSPRPVCITRAARCPDTPTWVLVLCSSGLKAAILNPIPNVHRPAHTSDQLLAIPNVYALWITPVGRGPPQENDQEPQVGASWRTGHPGFNQPYNIPYHDEDDMWGDGDDATEPAVFSADRGAAVIDADMSGTLYGHIISSSTCHSRYAQMAGIQGVFEDILLRRGRQPRLVVPEWVAEQEN
ncbi:hypothetical protein B0T17DRAFT_615067 [Bombardia bombarda]|uniref:Uncharacterized protein n=1 Tax=Bombardia bombarda TaxID=252184 RepID=A0AA39X8I3_9PEZI|nr:hypothetical protein B0T17DRAFT_615067 [Bombardia bombarda]